MVVIRLARSGAKKRPFYHVVACDKRSKRDGKYLERLGYFNPVAVNNAVKIKLDLDKINKWVSVGAQLSKRVEFIKKQFIKDSTPKSA